MPSLSQEGGQFGARYSEASSSRQFGDGHWLVRGHLSQVSSASREAGQQRGLAGESVGQSALKGRLDEFTSQALSC